MQAKTILFKNASLEYLVSGRGKTLMLVHGFGEDRSIWDGLAAKLSENYQLLIPDLPGSGRSEMLTGEQTGIGDYAEALLAIIHAEDISKLTMIGHSMGGYITLAFAEKYADKLDAFGLFHSSAYADDAEKITTRKKAIEFIQQNGSKAFLKTSIPGMFANPEVSKPEIDNLLSRAVNFKEEALIQYYQAMIERPDRTEVLQTFSGPIMFMLGTQDKAVPLEAGLKQSHLPSISHIHVLESGHMGMLEQPDNSLLKMMHFLSSVYVC